MPAIFGFDKANCIAIGTFNIYILQPKWLADMGVVERGEYELQTDLIRPGMRFRAKADDLTTWNVRPDRLVVESQSRDVDCGKLVSKVLRVLCWTPVQAVGANAIFKAGRHDVESVLASLIPDVTTPTGCDFEYASAIRAWKDGPRMVSVTFAVNSEDEAFITINVHRDIDEGETQADRASLAANECAACFGSLENARQMTSRLIGVELDNVPSNV